MMQAVGMALLGTGGGFLVAAGVTALLVGLGIITRFSGISHTAACARYYETAILFGALFGNLLTAGRIPMPAGWPGLALFGLFAGIYVGGWIMALAEVSHIFPVFSRRIGLIKGTGFVVAAVAAGKVAGSFIQFYMRW